MKTSAPIQSAVRIVEVGPRDGLQNVKTTIATATKRDLILRLADAGHTTIELTSMVSPKAVPQLSDGKALLQDTAIQELLRQKRIRLPVLVPNLKGLTAAVGAGVSEVAVFVSATEGFSRANINATVDEALLRVNSVCEAAALSCVLVRGLGVLLLANTLRRD